MTKYRKNKSLLSKAREIFGDVVVSAYVADTCWDEKSKSGLAKLFQTIRFDNPKSISFGEGEDIREIVLKFQNGKIISFFSSEWGSMSAITEISEKDIL